MAEIEQFLSKDAEKQVKNLVKLMGQLSTSYEEAFKKSAKLDENLKKISKSTEDTKKKKVQLTEAEKEEARILKATATTKAKLEQIQSKSNKLLIQQQQDLQNRNKELKTTIALENTQIGTLEKLALQNQKLTGERKKLNLETDKGKKRLLEINSQLDKNNKLITASSDKFTQTKRGIGGYTEAINKAAPALGTLGGKFSAIQFQLAAMQGSLRAIIPATNANTSALKKFRIALIATGIGAIVVALGTLIAAFASTQQGIDAINSVLRPLSTIFGRLIGVIQDLSVNAFGKLKDAINNPMEALKSLGRTIKENVINRFKAFQVFGESIALLLDGKFSASAKKAADGFIQFGTGITNGTDKLINATDKVTDFVNESIEMGKQLDDLIKKFEQRQIDLEVPIANARLEFEKFRAIAQDQTKTDQERINALNEAEKQQRFIIAAEKELRDLQIDRLALEQEFNDTSRTELLELEKLKSEALKEETAAQRKINGLIALRTGIEKKQVTASKLASKEILDDNIQRIELTEIAEEEGTDKYLEELDKRVKATAKANKDQEDETLNVLDKIKEKLEEVFGKEYAAIIGGAIQLGTELFKGFQETRKQQLSDESNALELQRQTALEGVKGQKDEEDQINDQFNRKQAVIKQKQWKAEQNAALFQIAIQTAVNATKGFPALTVLALLLGATQAAFVKAQKPPKFGKGSKGLQKDTYAEVGEAGRELLFMPGGGVALAEQSTKALLPKGTVIKTNKETEQILAANQLRASRENDVMARDYSELKMLSKSIADDRKSVLKAVSDRDQYLFNVSKEGIINLSKRNKSGVTTYLDNRFP